MPALPWFFFTLSQAKAKFCRLYTLSISEWTFCFPRRVPDDVRSCLGSVSSGSGLGLSPRELSNCLLLTHRVGAFPLHSEAQGLPPPPSLLGDGSAPAPGWGLRACAGLSFLSNTPCSDSWHRLGWNFAARLYPHLPSGGSRLPFVFPVGPPFRLRVSQYRNPPFPVGRYQASLGHTCVFPTVSPAHTVVRRGGTHAPSPS
jgi:hypothetical protein